MELGRAIWEAVREIGLSGVIDIAFMALLIYVVLVWFKRTRAAFVLTGIVITGAIYLLARQFNLILTASLLQGFFAVILVAIIVIFQEELRHFFEQIAVFSLQNPKRWSSIRLPRREVEVLVRTLTDLAREHTGALVVIRGHDPIVRHLEGGVDLNGELSEPLLKSIFDSHSIGHDGAAVIERNQLVQFSCHLPLSKNFQKLQHRGTRHAAALGLSELTDALCLVVSEERGTITAFRHGELSQMQDSESLSRLLEDYYREITPARDPRPWQGLLRRNYREKGVALLISMTLWFVLVQESKWVQRSFTVPVESASIPNGLTLEQVRPPKVSVTLSGPRRAFYLLHPERIRLVVRVANRHEGTARIPLTGANVTFPKQLTLEALDPSEVSVELAREE
ncbi:MAG TPA: diadenylate cyclase [bacterium]